MEDLITSYSSLYQRLRAEGHLSEQFGQLMMLEDEENPTFVTDTIGMFLEECQKKMERLSSMIHGPDPNFRQLDEVVHQFKGSCASVGADRLVSICVGMRQRCLESDVAGFTEFLNLLGAEYKELLPRLQQLMAAKDAIRAAGGQVPLFE